jgi:hypothetical protein
LDIDELVTSPTRKIRKTSAQAQVEKENKKKVKAVQNRAHARATALVAEERVMERSLRRSTEETEVKNPGYKVSLCKSTINKYVANNMSGVFPLLRGPESIMPSAAMTLLALAFESYCQINQVNNDPIERKFLIISTYHKHHSVYFRQRRRRILNDSTGLYRVRIEMHSGRG